MSEVGTVKDGAMNELERAKVVKVKKCMPVGQGTCLLGKWNSGGLE